MDRLLSQGTTGQDVRAVQDVLNFHIRRGTPLAVDGVFGPKTDARVKEFQKINNLKADGIVGPKTREQLFEVTDVVAPLFLMPRLLLPEPRFGAGPRSGIQPPRLIPPLQWPGPPIPAPAPFNLGGSFRLSSGSLAVLPSLTGPPNAVGFKVTVPTRKDPTDPFVQSRKAILELIDDLPFDSKFKGFLVSTVPQPITRFVPPEAGFKWGLAPLFNPFDPKGFGVKGNAQFTIRLTQGVSGSPNIVFGAWGDGKFFLNFDTNVGEGRPKVEAEGQVFLGAKGTF